MPREELFCLNEMGEQWLAGYGALELHTKAVQELKNARAKS